MKNPIKNGKEVFAVLSMATVMSISMSVKVDAASGAESKIDTAAASAAHAVVENVDNAPSANKVEETIAAKEDTAKLEDTKKEALVEEATDPGSSEVAEGVSGAEAKEAALEVSGENKGEAVRSAEGQASQAQQAGEAESEEMEVSAPANNEAVGQEAPKEEKEEEKQPQAPKPLTDEETAKLETAAKRARPEAKSIEVDKTTGWITVTTKVKVKKGEEEVEEERKETINPYTPAGDEALIKDFDNNERYRSTQMEQGAGPTASFDNLDKENEFVDGYRYKTLEPSPTSPDKTKWGFEIEIDKEKGRRTYTDFAFTNSGLMGGVLSTGNIPAKSPDDGSLGDSFKTPNYKATTEIEINGSGKQRNLNAVASEENLKRINNINNKNTTMAWEGHYKVEDPKGPRATTGSNAAFTFTVNPWPNENDKLSLIKLQGEYKDKVFVQGQKVNTGVKVQNLDENAKKRLVGQVYNPNTGKVVPGAKAYIDANGIVQVEMPKGAINEDGTLNKESIFYKDNDYKGIQSLDVKFFARPRTEQEFRDIGKAANYGEDKYTSTGAGKKTINHNGENVEVDLQGIDRYDHYNLIGKLKINLDDTRYYNQRFEDGNNEDTSTITSSAVKPGEDFKVKIVQPNDPTETDKSALDMNKAESKGEAAGNINLDFINKANEGKAEKDKWKVDVNPSDISEFTITPPKSAKAGDFVAIPVEYTYTNGSKDVHWFHFVVQESDNYRPEYHAEIGYKGDTLTNTHEKLPSKDETKKNLPTSYELVMPEDGSKYKDSAGNEWTNITVDPKTGAVTAVVPEDADIKGGENLFVDVKVNYIDEKTGEAKEEIVKAQFIARPKYKQEVTKTFNSKIPFETKVIYDENLEIGKVVKTEGRVGETETTFKQVVINGEKGIVDENGNFVKDKEAVVVKTITEKVDAEIRIGTKPAVTTVTIPSDTDYETSDSLKKGDMQLKEKGEDGEVTITTKRDPETGEITTTKDVTKKAKNKKMLIGTKTENTIVHEEKIPFEYEVTFDPSLKPGEKVVDQEGKPGSKTTTYKIENSQVVGDPTVEEIEPVKAKIRVGSEKYTGETSHKVTEETKYITIVEEDPTLPVGETKEVQPGVRGSKTTKYTQKFENGVPGEIKEEVISETPAVNRIIKVGTKTVTEHISKEITEEIPYGVKIEYDSNMPAGKSKVKTKGVPGSKTTEYYRNLINGKFDGDLNERELEDKYKAPVDEVIVVGTKVAENNKDYNNDVDVEIEYVKDDSKYLGYVEKGELTNGHVETKIINKFDPETGKINTTEEEVVKPAKQKIIVGTKKFTGEFKHTIEKILPFETEIQYDDTMEAGTKKVTQKGVNGSAEHTVVQKYTNGELADKEYSKEETKKEPVKEIVKIGTKPVEKKVEIPFNTEYVYDNTIDAGTVVEDKDNPGKAGSVTVKTYFDKESGKFVSVEDETSKVAAVNKIVRVGTKPTENMCPAPENPSGPDDQKPNGPKEEEPSKPNEPGIPGETPNKPNESGTPGVTPNTPNKPGENTPSEPGKKTPNKPGENPSEDPKNPPQESPEKPNLEKENDPKVSEAEKAEKVKEAEEAKILDQVKKEEDEEASRVGNEAGKANLAGDDKAPKTGDAGLMAETASAGIASGLLLLLGRFKRKKEDEE